MAEKKYTRIVVEENNEHGFDSYRVPGIVTASNGAVSYTHLRFSGNQLIKHGFWCINSSRTKKSGRAGSSVCSR